MMRRSWSEVNRDLRGPGEWMGAPSRAIFNFSPRYSPTITPRKLRTDVVTSARPLDMDIHLQSFTIPHFPSLMIAMSKPAYLTILEYSPSKPVIVFVPSRQQC